MEANQSSPVKDSVADDSTNQKQAAFTHLAQGKRHLLVRDYAEATASLAEACKLLDAQYGECANECGDAYFNYGKALLELARSESGVLGDAIEGEHDGSDDEDDGEEDEEAGEQGDENGEEVENGKTEEEKDDGAEEKEGVQEESAKDDEEKSDNEDNLKLAWEILEVAKLIFERQAKGNSKISLMLAEVYLKLGEVSLESENYEQAIEDIESCLRIQTEHLPEDDRYIGETYYQLGIAYSLNTNFDQSIKNFKNAADVIVKRIKNLETKKESGNECVEETKSDPFYSLDREITELKELLPEIQDKVNDMEDFKKETLKAMCNNLGGQSSIGADGSGSSSSAAVPQASPEGTKTTSNISHLVRKKRKPDETSGDTKGTEAAIVPVKQAKTE